jgi:hypothetical protein
VVDHLDHDNWHVAWDKVVALDATPPQSAVALVVIKTLAAAIADEGGGAVDFLAVAVAFDHRPAHFLVGLRVDTGNRDQIGSYDYKPWHPDAMPEVEARDAAFERRMRIVMEA